MMESSATLLQKPGNSQLGGYLNLQITFTGIDCFKIILMMGAAIDNILCDHNHSHSIIYVAMNLSASLKYFSTSVDMPCPIIVKCCSKTVCYCGLWKNVFSKIAEWESFN